MRLIIPAAALALTACVQNHEALDVGAVCARGDANTLDIELAHTCVSSSQFDRDYSCGVTLDGDEIVVESVFTYSTKGNSTTLDCGTITTECSIDVPDDGTYTVIHGEEALDIEIVDGAVVLPVDSDAVCSAEVL